MNHVNDAKLTPQAERTEDHLLWTKAIEFSKQVGAEMFSFKCLGEEIAVNG